MAISQEAANSLLFLLLCLAFLSPSMATYSVVNFGAKPDGLTDSSDAFLSAWSAACADTGSASIAVPTGRFLIKEATFQGPCNSTAIRMIIDGTLVAPASYTSATDWLMFKYVRGVSILGGTIDGRGQAFWDCKKAGQSCPQGATSLAIMESQDVLVSGLTSLNSEVFHVVVFGSSDVKIQGATITAPGDSPNTDGIHIERSSGVTILSATIRTGDDCISMGKGATGIWAEKIACGPGHGISIGSLGDSPSEEGVENVTVTSVVFSGTQNGVRVKTWGKPNGGFVKDVTFSDVIMQNVQNPIVVDQNYCPGNVNCPGQSSGVKISEVVYSDIRGTSATPVAVKFDCSPTNPCSGIELSDIQLTYQNEQAEASCRNAQGSSSGTMNPPSCV